MTIIQIIIIIIIILYILNNITITSNNIIIQFNNKNNSSNNKNDSSNNKNDLTNNKNDLTNNINKYNTYKLDKKVNLKNYGKIQYDIINYDNNEIDHKYQDLDIIKKDNKLELSENINEINKYNKLTKIINKFDSSQNNPKKQIITNLPSQQDIIYDTKFYQPSDADTHKPSNIFTDTYKDRTIQEVYDNIVNGNNTNKINKTKLIDFTEFKTGASGLKTFKNIDWDYEDEDDGMSYDPRSSILSTF
jgi:hypothetical protein